MRYNHTRGLISTDPVVRFVFEEMERQKVSRSKVARRSGVETRTIYKWKRKNNPTLPNIVAVLNALGYKLEVVKDEGSQ